MAELFVEGEDGGPTTRSALVGAIWRLRDRLSLDAGATTMHVAALATVWGDDGLKEFLGALKANGVHTAGSNDEVKRLVASGEVAFGLVDTDDLPSRERAADRSNLHAESTPPCSIKHGFSAR